MPEETIKRFRLGPWLVDPMLDTISRDGAVVKLEPRAMRLLSCLAKRAGEVSTIQELLDECWRGVVVTSQSVYQAVAQLRSALGDNPLNPTYIASIPRRGYRLVAPVIPVEEPVGELNQVSPSERPSASSGVPGDAGGAAIEPPIPRPARWLSRRRSLTLAVIGVASICAAALLFALAGKEPAPQRSAPGTQATNTVGPAKSTSDAHVIAPPGPSIVVLPFVNLSNDPDQQYVADGLAQEVTVHLASVKGLRVIARTGLDLDTDKPESLQASARSQNITHLLRGNVRPMADHLEVTTQLIRADSGEIVSSGRYDIALADLFRTQDQIARATVQTLQRGLTAPTALGPHYSPVDEAYRQFLLGRKFAGGNNVESWRLAAAAFNRAIDLDPHYAAAHANLVEPETDLWGETGDSEWLRRARADADQAVALGPDQSDSYLARAILRHWYDFDWDGSKADFERALALDTSQSDGTIEVCYAQLLASTGQLPSAIAALRRAIETDPLSHDAWLYLGVYLIAEHHYPAADQALRRAIEIEPRALYGWGMMGILQLHEGQSELALKSSEKLQSEALRLRGRALAEHSLGHAESSRRATKALIARYARFDAYQIAQIFAWRGEKDAAFDWLNRALLQRDAGLAHLKYDSLMESLRADPRYLTIVKRMNLSI